MLYSIRRSCHLKKSKLADLPYRLQSIKPMGVLSESVQGLIRLTLGFSLYSEIGYSNPPDPTAMLPKLWWLEETVKQDCNLVF